MELPGFIRTMGRRSNRRTSLAMAATGLLAAGGVVAAQTADQPTGDVPAPPPVDEESTRKRKRCIRCPGEQPTVQYVERSVQCYGGAECTAVAECPSPLRAVSCQFSGVAGEVAPSSVRIYGGRSCVVTDYDVSGELVAQVVCM